MHAIVQSHPHLRQSYDLCLLLLSCYHTEPNIHRRKSYDLRVLACLGSLFAIVPSRKATRASEAFMTFVWCHVIKQSHARLRKSYDLLLAVMSLYKGTHTLDKLMTSDCCHAIIQRQAHRSNSYDLRLLSCLFTKARAP